MMFVIFPLVTSSLIHTNQKIMDYANPDALVLAYYASNVAGLFMLVVALKWTRLARALFVIMFGYAAYINFTTGLHTPEVYLDYAKSAVPFYADFINGWFREHIEVSVGVIAFGQLLISIAMLMRREFVVLSCMGIIFFLIAISPLGYYAAFPFSITVSIAAISIMKRDAKEYLWKRPFASRSSTFGMAGHVSATANK